MKQFGKIVDVPYRELHWRITDELRISDLILYCNSLYEIVDFYKNSTNYHDVISMRPLQHHNQGYGYPEITFKDEFSVRTVQIDSEEEYYLMVQDTSNYDLEEGDRVEIISDYSYSSRLSIIKIDLKYKLDFLIDPTNN